MNVLTDETMQSHVEASDLDLKFLFASSQVQLTIQQVMTPHVMTLEGQLTMAEAAIQMSGKGLSCAVVLEEGRVVGMLTQKDFLFGLASHGSSLYERQVALQMSTPVHTVTPQCSVIESCRFMDHAHIRRLPVVDNEKLVGIVTQTDLTRALTSYGAFREIREIMTPAVVTADVNDTLDLAINRMSEHRISCIVVLSEGHPVGILTERDVVGKISSRKVNPSRIRVDDVMSSPLATIDSRYSIHSAARVMDQKHFHRLVVMEDGKLLGLVTQSDIFRAAHQKLLMEESNRFRLLARSANSSFVLNGNGDVVYANPAFHHLLELEDAQSLLEQPLLPECYWVHPNEREEVIEKLMAGDTDIDELVLKTAKGNVRYVSVITTSTMDIEGKLSGTQGVLYDHTERHHSQTAMAQANRELQAANQELKQMQAQIIQNEKMASIGQLAAGVAHEMNTPVGFVASNFQTLEKYMGRFLELFKEYERLGDAVEDGQKEKRLQILDGIKKSRDAMRIDFILDDLAQLFDESREGLERVTTIIRNLRDFSRIDQVDSQAAFNLNEALEATLIVARNEIKYCAEVEKDFGNLPPIHGNASQINQVFLNILVNAAQAIGMQEDRTEEGWIRIKTWSDEPYVVCTIEDNGPGIPAEIRQRVFEPFFTTKPPGKGTGLGLNVSHDIIVNKHKGQLIVESEMGKGTCFTIKLPIKGPDVS